MVGATVVTVVGGSVVVAEVEGGVAAVVPTVVGAADVVAPASGSAQDPMPNARTRQRVSRLTG